MKGVGDLLCLLALGLCWGCVSLDKPAAVAECAATGTCQDPTSGQSGGSSGRAFDGGQDARSIEDAALTGGAGGSGDASQVGGSGAGGRNGSGGSIDASSSLAAGGELGTGGVVGAGGSQPADASAGAGGVVASGGTTFADAAGSDARIGSGGVRGDGALGADVDVAVSGGSPDDGAIGADGIAGTGGATGRDAAVGTGGNAGTGGATSGGTGGTHVTGCGSTASTQRQTFSFATGLGTLSLGAGSTSGAHLQYVATGPAANPALCNTASGCAALSLTFTSGTAAYASFALAVESFSPTINLVGSTVTFSLAVDNPGATEVPIQIQGYAQGDATSNYTWTQPATVSGASLLSYAVANGFKDLALSVADNQTTTGTYCASVTGAIGIQLQNSAAITSGNAGTVTVYIGKITITPP